MRALAIAAVTLALAAPAWAETGAAKPRPAACHSGARKAKGSACAKARKRSGPVDNGATAFARCRDIHSHLFTRCGGPNAEPVPAN